MAFNAGSIDATLTLNRNPFTAGLAAAKNQARSFANERYEATLRVKVDDTELNKVQKETENFAKQSRTATAKVNVDRLMFDKLVKDLREFGRQTYTATVRVNTQDSSRAIRSLIKDLGDGDSTIKRFGNTVENETNRSNKAFKGMDGTVRGVLLALPILLPAAGSAVTGVIGLVGALISILTVAAAGAGAFALVAVPAFKKVQTAVAAGQGEINKLPPGLREAGNALQGLTKAYTDLQTKTQKGVGLAMAAGFNAATAAIKTLTPVINAMSAVLVKIGGEIQKYFGTAHWKTFVDFLAKNVGPVFQLLWDIVKNVAGAVINLTEAFMPLGTWLLTAIATGMAEFAKWTATLAKDPAFQHWIGLVKDALTVMWDVLKNVVQFIFNLATALTPLGNAIWSVIGKIFEALNKLPPEWLAAIAMGITGIMAAILLGAGGQVALVAGAILALAGAFSSLYDSNEKFRKSINDTVSYLQSKFAPIWDTISNNFKTKIVPAWDALVKAWKDNLLPVLIKLGDQFDKVLWPILQKIAEVITGQLIPNILHFIEVLAPIGAFITDKVGTVAIKAFELIGAAFVATLKVISDAFALFSHVFTGDWRAAWEDIKRIYEDIMSFLRPEFETMWEDIKRDFNTFKEQFKVDWAAFLQSLKDIWDGWIGGFKLGFGEIFTWIEDQIGLKHGTIVEIWKGLWDDLKGTFDGVVEAIKKAWDFMFGDVQANLDKRGKEIRDAWEGFWGPIRDFVVPLLDQIKKAWNDFWGADDGIVPVQTTKQEESHQSFLGWIADLVSGILTFISDVQTNWNNFWAAVSQRWEDFKAATTFSWSDLWATLLTAAVGFIANVVTEWNNFWAGIGATLDQWTADLRGRWDTFWNGIWTTVNDFGARIGQSVRDFMARMGVDVDTAAANIGQKFRAVANFFRDPINWVIRVVINDGIVKAWNTVMGWIGAPGIGGGLPEIPAFAMGGPIQGGTPGRDSVPIMAMPGEYVLSAKAVKKLGGTQAVEIMHKMARGNSTNNTYNSIPFPGFADGGPIGGIISGIMDVGGLFGAIPTAVPGAAGSAGAGINAIPKALIGAVLKAATDKVSSFLATIAAAVGGGGGSAVASGPIAQIIAQTAAQFGWGSGAQMAALNWIISHESGFNPNAQNPTSTAYGLFQFLNGTWASTGIAKTSDPSLQALAGMRYIQSRYGSPVGAQAFWQANGWYDNGGWLAPGNTVAMNGTGSPEAVLTAPQWDAVMNNRSNDDILRKLDQLIQAVEENAGGNVNIVGTNDPAENARRAVLALKLRRR